MSTDNETRCAWASSPPIYAEYHDTEWGVPLRDERLLFEFLVLETFQAGLSWLIVLRKRASFREAFADFDPEKVARFGERRLEALAADKRIIRNRAKISAAVQNAQAFLAISEAQGSFADYIWQLVEGAPIVNHWQRDEDIPATTPLAATIAKDLKRRGFKFMGPTVVYAHMQATGMVNDHVVQCFRHAAVQRI